MTLSIPHLLLILVIMLVVFGPSRLPTLGKSMGEAIRGFKEGLNDNTIEIEAKKENKDNKNQNV